MQQKTNSPLQAPMQGADCPGFSCDTLVLGRWGFTAGLMSSVRAELHELPQSVTYIVEPLVQLALETCLFVFNSGDLLLQRIETVFELVDAFLVLLC